MTTQEMSEKIVEAIKERPYASFVELVEACGEEATGDLALEPIPNVFIWHNMSRKFIDAFDAVRPRVELHATSVLTYMADGRVSGLPIATAAGVKRGYKKPHWAPVTFTLRGRDDRDA